MPEWSPVNGPVDAMRAPSRPRILAIFKMRDITPDSVSGSEESEAACQKSSTFPCTRRSRLRQDDDIMLAHLLDGFPGAPETRRDDEAVASFERPALARLIGQHRLAGDEVAELPLRIVDVGLAGLRFPDAAQEPAVLAGPMVPGGGRSIAFGRRRRGAFGPHQDDLLSQSPRPFLSPPRSRRE